MAAAILNFRLPGTSDNIHNSSNEKLVPENVRIAVGFSILRTIQVKIQQLLCSICEIISVSSFAAAILDSWIGLSFIELHCFVVQSFPDNVLEAFRLTPSGFEMAVKRLAWVHIPPAAGTRNIDASIDGRTAYVGS